MTRNMEEQYGKMRGSTMRIIIDAAKAGRARKWLDLLPHIVPQFKDGDTLKRVEAEWLADWLAEEGRADLELEDVQTVQIPRDWAAEALGGHAESASRALTTLQVAGILTPVHKGIKGHASLYCVNPLPAARGPTLTYDTAKCEGKYPHTSQGYPHTSSEMPSHHDSMSWGDTT